LLFNREGNCLAAKLRSGNVHSAGEWEGLLLPEIYEALEERGVKYAIRIPANDSLERNIAELLNLPVGRPSHKPVVWYKCLLYQAASWKRARRVLPRRIDNWPLTGLQQRLVKTGGRLVKHARYDWLLLAESHFVRRLFGAMVRHIAALPLTG
jgi:hypothetical protein